MKKLVLLFCLMAGVASGQTLLPAEKTAQQMCPTCLYPKLQDDGTVYIFSVDYNAVYAVQKPYNHKMYITDKYSLLDPPPKKLPDGFISYYDLVNDSQDVGDGLGYLTNLAVYIQDLKATKAYNEAIIYSGNVND